MVLDILCNENPNILNSLWMFSLLNKSNFKGSATEHVFDPGEFSEQNSDEIENSNGLI